MQETQVRSLGQEDPLEEGMATHSSVLAWKIPWTEEPERLQSMESQKSDAAEHTGTLTLQGQGLIPGSRKYPGGGPGNLLQSSCWENPMDRGAWLPSMETAEACVLKGHMAHLGSFQALVHTGEVSRAQQHQPLLCLRTGRMFQAQPWGHPASPVETPRHHSLVSH